MTAGLNLLRRLSAAGVVVLVVVDVITQLAVVKFIIALALIAK